MKNEEILRLAIKQAKDYPYQFYGISKDGWVMLFPEDDGVMTKLSPFQLIFSHDFAKAFWGEYWGKKYENDITLWHPDQIPWQWHLQQMVLEEDPIKYLEQFISPSRS